VRRRAGLVQRGAAAPPPARSPVARRPGVHHPVRVVAPWEDFAEIWAHDLHITDTLQTAVQHSLFPDPRRAEFQGQPQLDFDVAHVAELIEVWVSFAGSFNELQQSMGKPDPYPFTLSPQVVDRLGFVHRLVPDTRGSGQSRAARTSGQPGAVRGVDQ
jgi:hypothetical protein